MLLSPAIPGHLRRMHTIQTSYPGSSVPCSLCFLSSHPAPILLSLQTIPLQTLCALFQSKQAPFYSQLLHRTLSILPCLLKLGASPKATFSLVALSRAIFPHAIAHICVQIPYFIALRHAFCLHFTHQCIFQTIISLSSHLQSMFVT